MTKKIDICDDFVCSKYADQIPSTDTFFVLSTGLINIPARQQVAIKVKGKRASIFAKFLFYLSSCQIPFLLIHIARERIPDAGNSLVSEYQHMAQEKTLTDRELKNRYSPMSRCIGMRPNEAVNTHWVGMRVGEVAVLRIGDVVNADRSVYRRVKCNASGSRDHRCSNHKRSTNKGCLCCGSHGTMKPVQVNDFIYQYIGNIYGTAQFFT